MRLQPKWINTNKSLQNWQVVSKQVQNTIKRQLPLQKLDILRNSKNINGKKSIQQLLSNFQIPQYAVSKDLIKQSKKQVPQSVRSLDKMCQMMGFQQMGQIYSRPGNKYLARRIKRDQKGNLFYSDVTLKDVGYIQTPDIKRNLFYHSGKTVQKWNDFVEAEANMRIYMEKIQRNKNNPGYINQLAKSSSMGSGIYKILATLYYFYKERQINILNLNQIDLNDLYEILLTTGDLITKYRNLKQLLNQYKSDKIQFILNYQERKNNYFKASLTQDIFNQIQIFLNDKYAYLTTQMMQTPPRQLPTWTNMMIQPQINANVFKTNMWSPQQQTFKPDNYLQL